MVGVPPDTSVERPAADFALAFGDAPSTLLVARGAVYCLAVASPRASCRIRSHADGGGRRPAPRAPRAQVPLMVRGDNAAALGFYAALGLARQNVVVLGRFLNHAKAA